MDRHAIIMADSDGIVRHWSEGAARLIGYSPAEAIGQKVDLVVPWPCAISIGSGFTAP